ncbi:MAG TPA: metallophosphoesterase [Candidatus Lokiarchaeia archaeon]|nr:metallophosphoesterase [Candidatus Lokiarchaeia archaeon]
MKIGILSDSHDNLPAMEKVVALFNKESVDHVIHCGDVVAPFTYRVFEQLQAKITAVFGNNDGEILGLKETFAKFGEISKPPKEIELDGKWILIDHFFTDRHLEALAASDQYFAILFGHTHQIVNKHIGNTIILNPGEVCGYLTGRCTCAILDTEAGTAEIREIES